jgi:hypothetical protein
VIRRPLHHARTSRFVCVFAIRESESIFGESTLHEYVGVRVDDDHLLEVVGQDTGAEQAGDAGLGVSKRAALRGDETDLPPQTTAVRPIFPSGRGCPIAARSSRTVNREYARRFKRRPAIQMMPHPAPSVK